MEAAIAPNKTSVLFCPLCGKPSTQETSHTRHVQYCRRRAATKRTGPARTRACRHCRATKSKCDAQWPCRRCTSRQKECVYDKPWPTPDAVAAATGVSAADPQAGLSGSRQVATAAAAAAESGVSSSSTTGSDSNSPSSTSSLGQVGEPSCCPGLSNAPPFVSAEAAMALAVTPTTLAASLSATSRPMVAIAAAAQPGIDASFNISNFMFSPRMNMEYGFGGFSFSGLGSMDMSMPAPVPTSLAPAMPVPMPSPFGLHMPYAAPPDPVIEMVDGPVGKSTTPELRRLITSMVRTFPRMMTRPDNLPPFIHRVGCCLHYEELQQNRMMLPPVSSSMTTSLSTPFKDTDITPAQFKPLPLMAACVGISHAFVSRSPHSDEFLWRAIDKERQAIVERMTSLSFGEIFVSIQAVAIYTTMRLIVYGREYFLSDMSLLDTMSKLSERFQELWRGPFMPMHEHQDDDIDLARSKRPAWEDWIFDETRRRITATCWLMSLAVNPRRTHSFRLSRPKLFSLPSSRRLWEADSRASWERAYENDRIERYALRGTNGAPRLGTIGDLARAIDRSVTAEGSISQPNIDALFEDELLAHWHAGVDSLGMMITAAAAQYTFD